MTFPQHTHWRSFSFSHSLKTPSLNVAAILFTAHLKKTQLCSYCSLDFSFLPPPLCLRLPPTSICRSIKLHISSSILDCFTNIVLLWHVRSQTETVLLLLLWTETHALKNAPWGGPGMSFVRLCAWERQNQKYITVHACVWFCSSAQCPACNNWNIFCGLLMQKCSVNGHECREDSSMKRHCSRPD